MAKYSYIQCVEIMKIYIDTIEEKIPSEVAEKNILAIAKKFPIHNLKQYLGRTKKYLTGIGEFGFGFPSNWAQAFLEVTNNNPLVIQALMQQQELYKVRGKGENKKLAKILTSIQDKSCKDVIDVNILKGIDSLIKYLDIISKELQTRVLINKEFNSMDEELLNDKEMPFMLCYSKEVNSFIDDFYKSSLLLSDFKWSEWQNEAVKYFKNPELLNSANLEIIRKLLTLHIRIERICEPCLIGIIDNGHMVEILTQLAKIRANMSSDKYF